jgi:two-component system alkaline phosphatase synthesis response regulator PhoP
VPYKPLELQLRIKRLLWQRDKVTDLEVIKIAELTIHPDRYEVCVKGIPIELTFKEYELLKYLATHRGRAFNRESLLNIIWGYEYYGGTRTVDVHIRRIRAKVGDEEETYIKTVRGVGYMFKE